MAVEPSPPGAASPTEPAAPTDARARHPVPIGPDAPIFEVMASMRAMRRLKPDPAPDDLLEQIIAAATWAPNAAHLQHYSFVLVTDRAQIARLAAIWQPIVAFYKET